MFEKIIIETFPKLIKKRSPQIQNVLQILSMVHKMKYVSRAMTEKLQNTKKKKKYSQLPAVKRKKTITNKGIMIGSSLNTMETRRRWNNIFKILKENNRNS